MRASAVILALALGSSPAAQAVKPPPITVTPLGSAGLQPALRPVTPGQSLRGLPPNRSVGDPVPQCRARCAAARSTCDDDSCDQRWVQCLHGCDQSSER